jgi:restriction system protein
VKLRMAENSLFATLLRSPWWLSIGLAVGIALVARIVLPDRYAVVGALTGLPFAVIGAIVAWKQLRSPGTARVASTLEAIGAMSWSEFSSAIEGAFRRDGYTVTPLGGSPADYEISKGGRTSLVSCKRWKAATIGVESLRALHAVKEARDSQEGIYVAVGGITDSARTFASEKRIRVVQGAELAQMLRLVGRATKRVTWKQRFRISL